MKICPAFLVKYPVKFFPVQGYIRAIHVPGGNCICKKLFREIVNKPEHPLFTFGNFKRGFLPDDFKNRFRRKLFVFFQGKTHGVRCVTKYAAPARTVKATTPPNTQRIVASLLERFDKIPPVLGAAVSAPPCAGPSNDETASDVVAGVCDGLKGVEIYPAPKLIAVSKSFAALAVAADATEADTGTDT